MIQLGVPGVSAIVSGQAASPAAALPKSPPPTKGDVGSESFQVCTPVGKRGPPASQEVDRDSSGLGPSDDENDRLSARTHARTDSLTYFQAETLDEQVRRLNTLLKQENRELRDAIEQHDLTIEQQSVESVSPVQDQRDLGAKDEDVARSPTAPKYSLGKNESKND